MYCCLKVYEIFVKFYLPTLNQTENAVQSYAEGNG